MDLSVVRHRVGTILKWVFRLGIAALVLIGIVLVFFSWQASGRESKTSIEAAPDAGHFVKAGDADIFVQEAGPASGQPVLFIHGTGSWSEIWRETITPLADAGFHVIALDLPPFGYSQKFAGSLEYSREKQAARIIGVLDALKITKVILVAHSVGSRPAVEAALERPDLVQKLVLVAPALGYPASPEAEFQFKQNNPSGILKKFLSMKSVRNAVIATYGTNPLSIRSVFSSFVFNKEAITEARVQTLEAPLSVLGTTAAYGDWFQYLVAEKDTSLATHFENFKDLTMPTLLIWGDKDTTTLLWQGEKLHKLIPGSEMAVIPNVGHMPYLENVTAFNDILLGFLKKQ